MLSLNKHLKFLIKEKYLCLFKFSHNIIVYHFFFPSISVAKISPFQDE